MRGVKPLAIVMIISMLSACASRNAPIETADDDPYLKNNPYIEESVSAESAGEQASDAGTVDQPEMAERLQGYRDVASNHPAPRHHDDEDRYHYHQEPSPEAQYAAEVTLLVTAQIFVCSFVVVVLNGHCDLHVSTGFYY